MPLGRDQQYDETWAEQDKVRRRKELKLRLKAESIRGRFNPFLHMKEIPFIDPAVERYCDLRKKGRMPNAPFSPKLFFTISSGVFIPIILLAYAMEWERRPYLEACAKGEYPIEKRYYKSHS